MAPEPGDAGGGEPEGRSADGPAGGASSSDAPGVGGRTLEVWPAVDLLDGRCVRLFKGRFDDVTEFSRDPVAVAEAFAEGGARNLHVVDLDGAREGRPVNGDVVLEIRRRLDVRLQVGGGLRDDGSVRRFLEAGVDRVILGTGAVRRPEWISGLVERHGTDAVAAGVDVRDGEVVVEGWEEGSGLGRDRVLDALAGAGVETVVYTDTVRDGTLTRPDVQGAADVAGRGFRTLVAGGVSRAADLADLREAGVRGVVIGSALHHGTLTLEEALAAAAGDPGTVDGGGGDNAGGSTAAGDGADADGSGAGDGGGR